MSLWVQIQGLVGSEGILPVSEYLKAVLPSSGEKLWYRVPTLCWLDAGDLFLNIQCGLGVLCSIVLLIGIAPLFTTITLWILYTSLVTAGQTFLSFQWDILLLETGFLAIWWSPVCFLPRWIWFDNPSYSVLWLLRWLQFRLMFSSGVVKLTSGDAVWSNLTALNFHYETQPLPTRVSWYAHQFPDWFQSAGVLVVFAVELVVPFGIFGGRCLRISAALAIGFLQIIIAVTGNYGYFNILALVLCVPLLDDRCVRSLVGNIAIPVLQPCVQIQRSLRQFLVVPIFATVLLISVMQLTRTLGLSISSWPTILVDTQDFLRPLKISNGYGLFAVMTTNRHEIEIEGSADGEIWHAYEFKWKPGSVMRAPSFVTPHMPRLDWQMWFAALRPFQESQWVPQLMVRLLQGSGAVGGLFQSLPPSIPTYVRARLYDYRFSDWNSHTETGYWWKRVLISEYSPTLSLRKQ